MKHHLVPLYRSARCRSSSRRAFDETGCARTILVVDAPGPWVGTTRLDALES